MLAKSALATRLVRFVAVYQCFTSSLKANAPRPREAPTAANAAVLLLLLRFDGGGRLFENWRVLDIAAGMVIREHCRHVHRAVGAASNDVCISLVVVLSRIRTSEPVLHTW